MAKRIKYPKLRNGFGSIRYLGKGRRNPYAVLAPTAALDERGRTKYDKPICYAPNWQTAFSVLLKWHAGTWISGSKPENVLNVEGTSQLEALVERIMEQVGFIRGSSAGLTFSEVYDRYLDYKLNGKRDYSASSVNARKTAYKNCMALHDRIFTDLRLPDLQKVVDDCPKKHATKELIVLLIKQMYAYAETQDWIEKDYSKHLTINTKDDDEHGVPFSTEELAVLWQNTNHVMARMLLIMCYSGFRINEYRGLIINTEEGYFQGGSKTKAGKNRTVPIHSAILDFVHLDLCGKNFPKADIFRKGMYAFLDSVNLPRHTPHDCRHTFAMLCDKFGVAENDKKRMLGHAFSDVTNAVYGHRELESLRAEIEKIRP